MAVASVRGGRILNSRPADRGTIHPSDSRREGILLELLPELADPLPMLAEVLVPLVPVRLTELIGLPFKL
jgi:hypothetical protein